MTTSHRPVTDRPSSGTIIPEEWKSADKLWPEHLVQIGVDFLVIEDQLKVIPPYGVVVLGDGTRHRIENDATLRAKILELNRQCRAAKAAARQPIVVNPRRGQCRSCGQRENCQQARG